MVRQHMLRPTRSVRATNSWESDGSALLLEHHSIIFHDEEGANARHSNFRIRVRRVYGPLRLRLRLWQQLRRMR